jgi:hypothetical protein
MLMIVPGCIVMQVNGALSCSGRDEGGCSCFEFNYPKEIISKLSMPKFLALA